MSMSGPNIIQLSEFDVTQKIIESLANVCSRAVLFSVRDAAKDAGGIAGELGIPVSTIYKTLSHLEHLALIEVDRFVFSKDGKKTKLYRSRIGKVEISMNGVKPVLNLYPNTGSRR